MSFALSPLSPSGFLELHSNTFHGGLNTEISFVFKTDQMNGLLLFVYNKEGPDYLAVSSNVYLFYILPFCIQYCECNKKHNLNVHHKYKCKQHQTEEANLYRFRTKEENA